MRDKVIELKCGGPKMNNTETDKPYSKASFTVSVRRKYPDQNVADFLEINYPNLPLANIDSVFGFVEQSTLYGGRNFVEPELVDEDIQCLYGHQIGLRLPLTNKFVSRAEYEQNIPLLEKYHRKGNAVIIYKDDLARWIRRDFPLYHIEGSVIKALDNHEKINRALDLYDSVVLPASLNDDAQFLETISLKSAITLFANAGCAYNCPAKICYTYLSRVNKYNGQDAGLDCSKTIAERDVLGMVDFDLRRLATLGFSRFKLLRGNPTIQTAY